MHCWAADGDEIHEWLLCSWVWIWIMDFQNELYGHTHTHTQICTSILTRTLHWHACILTRALAKGNTHNSSPKSSLMYSRNTWSKGSMTQRHFKTEVHWGLLTASDWQVISLTGRGVYWLHLKKRVRGGRVGVGGVKRKSEKDCGADLIFSLSWRQSHWPVSPWCVAWIYGSLPPPLSSDRWVTLCWNKQRTIFTNKMYT